MRDSRPIESAPRAIFALSEPEAVENESSLTPDPDSRPLLPGAGRPTMIQKVRGQAAAIFLGSVQLYSEMTRSALSLLHRNS